jgi:hypothetical protein
MLDALTLASGQRPRTQACLGDANQVCVATASATSTATIWATPGHANTWSWAAGRNRHLLAVQELDPFRHPPDNEERTFHYPPQI